MVKEQSTLSPAIIGEDFKAALAAVVQSKNANKIIEFLETQEKALECISECNYKTNGVIPDFHSSIKDMSSIEELISAHASVRKCTEAYNEELVVLKDVLKNVKVKSFRLGGFSTEDILHDIVLRIQIITHEEHKNFLTKQKSEFREHVTKEDRFEKSINNLVDFFGK